MGKRKRSGSFSVKAEDFSSKKSDEDSQEELDPENVALSKGTTGGTRCSARVQEKQEKLRRESSPSKQILPLEVHCSSSGAPLSSATNLPKGQVKFPSPNNNEQMPSFNNESGINPQISQQQGLEEKRKKRTWELWSIEDKQLFFEALNEFGKDFDAIQNYLATKTKSKKTGLGGQYGPKNKDQVRHFYYRTWNKISKYLRFPDGMKKANQELYGLVNYGELRKKQRILNSKSAAKLCDMVESGITSIKFRGKTCRIKTPVCRALKRLNGLDDIDHTRVPHKISLEFIPKDGRAWRSVQSVSHNPRVKVIANLQRTFASVINYLEGKWKRNDDRLKEQFYAVFGKPLPKLRVVPVDQKDISIAFYRVAENTNSATICLRSYTSNVLGRDRQDEVDLLNSKIKRKRKQSGSGMCNSTVAQSNLESNTKKMDYHVDPETSDAESQSALLFSVSDQNGKDEQNAFIAEQSDENGTYTKDEMLARHFKSLEDFEPPSGNDLELDELQNGDGNLIPTETDYEEGEHELDEAGPLPVLDSLKPIESDKFVSQVWDEEQVRRGWTVDEAGVMTIGELYLMFGQTEKLSFEYFWDGGEIVEQETGCRNLLERLILAANLMKKKKSSRSKSINSNPVICGSQHKCNKCGQSVEIPPNPACVSKSCSSAIMNVIRTISPSIVQRNRANSTVEKPKPLIIVKDIMEKKIVANGGSSPVATVTACPSLISHEYPVSSGSASESELNTNQLFSSSQVGGIISTQQMENFVIQDGIELTPGNIGVQSTFPVQTPTNNNDDGLIDLCSLATNTDSNVSPKIKATLLPSSSCMVRNTTGLISVVSQSPNNGLPEVRGVDTLDNNSSVISSQNSDVRQTGQITFHIPIPSRGTAESEVNEFPPPKPFSDLSKGNRRLGRRPNFKRVVVPRVLPLLPQSQSTTSANSTVTSEDSLANAFPRSTVNMNPVSTISSTNGKDTATDQGLSKISNVPKCPEGFMITRTEKAGNNSNDFENLLTMRQQEISSSSNNINSADVDSISLSSFMEISLPESAKMTANECLSMEDFSRLGASGVVDTNTMSQFSDIMKINLNKDLNTPESSPLKRLQASLNGNDALPDFDRAWSIGADLSLSNYFQYDNSQRSSGTNAVNFQGILDDGSLDFSSKLTELTSPVSEGQK